MVDELYAAYEDDLGLQDVHFGIGDRVHLGSLDLGKLHLAQTSKILGCSEDQNFAKAEGPKEVQARSGANARTAIELDLKVKRTCKELYKIVYLLF